MADSLLSSEHNRKLRAHKKSRQGCGNCKLRKIKCDESKPKCQRCTAFGVSCNYDYKYPDLQLAVDRGFNVQVLRNIPSSLNLIIPGTTSSLEMTPQFKFSPEGHAIYQLCERDLELLGKFQERTVHSITTARSVTIYGTESIKLACSYPFLMHALLLVTLMHDRFLNRVLNSKLSATEAFHWYRSSSLMNLKLSDPMLQPSERDALWITSFFLGIAAFFHVDAKTPEEAWPLQHPSPMDLNWLKMSDGKKEVWKIAQPLRADCVFQSLALEWAHFAPRPPPRAGLEALPAEFIDLYTLDHTSNPQNNPYHAAACSLANSLDLDNPTTITLDFLSFTYSMGLELKVLLEQKDPRALLMLAYWYAKSCQAQCWWIWGRAWLECQAICIYLEREHPGEVAIQKLLEYPRRMCNSYSR